MGQAEQIYSREFDSIFFKLDQQVRRQIESKITEAGSRLAQYPHHRLKGRSEFRLRVGDYRIIYEFDLRKNVIYLIALGHRREIYR